MKKIYIGSMSPYSGKSVFTLGLGLALREMGFSIGYTKPIGNDPVQVNRKVYDSEALFFMEALGLDEPLERISPFVESLDMLNRTLAGKVRSVDRRILKAVGAISGYDILLIAGTRDIFEGSLYGINGVRIIKEMDARAVMVEKWNNEDTIDDICAAKDILEGRLHCVVFNQVRDEARGFIRKKVLPYLKKKDIRVAGIVPYDKILGSVPVRALVDLLGGKVLCAEDALDRLVENFSVGAMDVNNALRYFRATPNKAVITGAHRSDIQLAALETSTRCIILTGGLLPNDVIIGKARLQGVPIISVREDTFTVVDKIEKVLGRFRVREKEKIERALEVVRNNVDIKLVLK